MKNKSWDEWKANFCQYIGDWSYNSAYDELEVVKEILTTEILDKVLEIVGEDEEVLKYSGMAVGGASSDSYWVKKFIDGNIRNQLRAEQRTQLQKLKERYTVEH